MTAFQAADRSQAVPAQPSLDVWLAKDIRQGAMSWRNLVGPAISLGVLVACVFQLKHLNLAQAIELIPSRPTFWLALAGAYLVLPFSEWIIYRRLWKLPFAAMLPLLRKRISNEILLGYSGEVYFYAWVRRRVDMASAPFGVIKDVAILSAQVGNIVTLLLVAIAWPLLGPLHLGTHTADLILSSALVVLMSMPVLLFRTRLLTLPAPELITIGLVHLARVAVALLLAAAMWHEALPMVAWSWWLLLAALRQLLSRLPLMPNKDVAFAGLAAYLIGTHSEIVAMVAMTASLVLVLHLVLGVTLALVDLATPGELS
ncbi:hypothetical protein [Sphingomonas oryzagri]